MADDENNLNAAVTAGDTTPPAEDPENLIGKRVQISHEAKDVGSDNPHMWAGMFGHVSKRGPFGNFMITIGKKSKQFERTDFTVVADAATDAGATATAPAATPPWVAVPHTTLVEESPLAAINSPTNPRKRHGLDIDSLTTLAASLKVHGFVQPITVRPLPASRLEETAHMNPRPAYEVVAGERRWRASVLGELPFMPMLVRELSDEAVLELQLVENIEREDLDAMEEAEGFDLLRTKLGYTVEQIAERIGKGKGASYVRKTMKLLELTPESREAMYDGHLGRSTGLLVARYPAERQPSVVAFIKSQASKGPKGALEPAPYREIAPKIYTQFNTLLKAAPFDTEDVGLVLGAGACSSCPKRTGGDADLFGDAPNAPEACADDACFAMKRQANVQRIREQAQRDGFKVIDGVEANAAKPTPHMKHLQGFVRLADTAYVEAGKDGEEREVTFEDALRTMGRKAPKPRVFIDPHSGAAEKVITLDLADKLTPKEKEGEEPKGKAGKTTQVRPVDTSPPEVMAFRDGAVRRAVLFRLFDVIRGGERTLEELRSIARVVFCHDDSAAPRAEAYLGWEQELEGQEYEDAMRIIGEKIDAMTDWELGQAIAMGALEQVLTGWGYGGEEHAVGIIASYGIDILAVRDKVVEDIERQQQAEEPGTEAATTEGQTAGQEAQGEGE